jgi:hypothetical protein
MLDVPLSKMILREALSTVVVLPLTDSSGELSLHKLLVPRFSRKKKGRKRKGTDSQVAEAPAWDANVRLPDQGQFATTQVWITVNL